MPICNCKSISYDRTFFENQECEKVRTVQKYRKILVRKKYAYITLIINILQQYRTLVLIFLCFQGNI